MKIPRAMMATKSTKSTKNRTRHFPFVTFAPFVAKLPEFRGLWTAKNLFCSSHAFDPIT
jgi:hypothetical protein